MSNLITSILNQPSSNQAATVHNSAEELFCYHLVAWRNQISERIKKTTTIQELATNAYTAMLLPGITSHLQRGGYKPLELLGCDMAGHQEWCAFNSMLIGVAQKYGTNDRKSLTLKIHDNIRLKD